MDKPKVVEKKLGRSGAWGQWKSWLNTIEIDPRLVGKPRLETYIHEFTHKLHPEWSETQVCRESKAMTNFLWALYYRRIDHKEKQPKSS